MMFVTIIITIQYRGNILELVFVTSVLFFDIQFKVLPFGLLSGARKGISEQFMFDDTAFGAGAFSWQDPVQSWKSGPGEVMTVEIKQTNDFCFE